METACLLGPVNTLRQPADSQASDRTPRTERGELPCIGWITRPWLTSRNVPGVRILQKVAWRKKEMKRLTETPVAIPENPPTLHP